MSNLPALLFGGAFNPPTKAHIHLAELALTETGRQQVIFMPSKSRYIEEDQGKDFAYSEEKRLALLKSAASGRPWMRVSDWEIRQERQPRTYETLCHLREEGVDCAMLIGSDKLRELDGGWKYVPEIAREFGIVCLYRGQDDCEAVIRESRVLRPLREHIQLIRTPEGTKNVSSSEVRRRVAELRRLTEELEALLPEGISARMLTEADR